MQGRFSDPLYWDMDRTSNRIVGKAGKVPKFAFVTIVALAMLAAAPLLSGNPMAQSGSAREIAADTAPAKSPAENPGPAAQIDRWTGILKSTEQALDRPGLLDEDFFRFSQETAAIKIDSLLLADKLQPEFAQVNARLAELGDPPQEGEPQELPDIADKRQVLNQQSGEADSHIKAVRLVSVRARQLERRIGFERRERFLRSLFVRNRSGFDPGLWYEFFDSFDGYWNRLSLLFSDSLRVIAKRAGEQLALSALLVGVLICICGLFIFLRRWFMRNDWRLVTAVIDDRPRKILQALNSLALNGVLPALLLAAILFSLRSFGLLTGRLNELLTAAALGVAVALFCVSMAGALFEPAYPERRILSVDGRAARRILMTMIIAAIFVVIFHLLSVTSILLASPFQLAIGSSALTALTVSATGFLCFRSLAPRHAMSSASVRSRIFRPAYLKALLAFGTVVIFAALVTGYLALAEFMAYQLILTVTIFASLWLVLEFLDGWFGPKFGRGNETNRRMRLATGFSAAGIEQIGVAFGGLFRFAIILIALAALLLPWGIRSSDWYQWFTELFFGFEVGGITISISSVLLAVMVFFIGYLITRGVQNWLGNKFLPTTEFDVGQRNSIGTLLGYGGIALAVIIALSAAGIDLSNLAIVAGALSVGIGFGLQSIVNNFVSGLILLAERPIKSGDWVVTTGGEGTVRKISVRSTEIDTFDGATIIVPNSTLITDTVKNWTHHSKMGRVAVTVGVGYDSDCDKVREIMLAAAGAHNRVMSEPAPYVVFTDFGADALMFELRAYLADINFILDVGSDLRFAILAALRQAKIEIPFRQTDIHIRSGLEGLVAK